MQARELNVVGAYEFTPQVFPDHRGLFVSPFQEKTFIEAVGHPLFRITQTSHSKSKRGVVRGIHFTITPPGTAKYVYCPRGRSLDVVVDIRVGSPTFGKWDAVELNQETFRSIYLPVGVGHGFIILEDDTVMSYMLSGEYVAEQERALSALDPELGLPIPRGMEPILSERDQIAPTLSAALAQNALPDYEHCMAIERELQN
ncbi:dTDP-4-dehydrorhamnose 3,5-epimerase [Nocardiopsis dassonvillei]|uniref:dTDP-4-dehydrorhamnose 3,5-epimerase family protein n=1 Tax=Nocardiopsis dassonvillei TaxID=2014 RepID=UPI00200BD228|nr:dTDP-4-dehydrorhamnose 3,5-epimerase [Nocardiopsis dassonvillei]MCK9868088.1 dTDP-4-dehydrorhamnose 3,5-epimerase [Nocardiopsis dassonvillei]